MPISSTAHTGYDRPESDGFLTPARKVVGQRVVTLLNDYEHHKGNNATSSNIAHQLTELWAQFLGRPREIDATTGFCIRCHREARREQPLRAQWYPGFGILCLACREGR